MIVARPTLKEAKTRFDIPALWTMLQIPGKPGRSVRCPFHEDRAASFSVYPGNRGELRWHCFAGCGGGGPVELVARALDLPEREACRWLLNRAGGEGIGSSDVVVRPNPSQIAESLRKFTLPSGMHRGTRAELATVAALRGLSVAGVNLARERGLLWFGSSCGFPAWIVTDGARVNAQSRRLDGRVFPPFKGLAARKTHTLGGSQAGWPVGTGEAADKPFVVLTEGGPDFLTAHHFIEAEERVADVAAVAMLGASHLIPEDALLVLANKRVRIFPHSDEAGQNAALRWCEQLERVGCGVDAFRFEGLQRCDGGMVGDLNDLALIDADSFESERAELLEVLPR